MITLSLDNNWDLFLDDFGNMATKSDKQQIAQDVASACRVWQGEDIWNLDRGVPYKDEIMGQQLNASQLQAYYSREAERIEGVRSIQLIIKEYKDRVLKQDILITTDDGELIDV